MKIDKAELGLIMEEHQTRKVRMEKIHSRIGEIVDFVSGYHTDWQYGDEDNDYEGLTFFECYRTGYNQDSIEILFDCNSTLFIDKFGEVWNFEKGIPARWLYEDFEDEFTKGKELYVKRQEEKKAKAKEDRRLLMKEKQKLIDSAATKLTTAEKKALGIK